MKLFAFVLLLATACLCRAEVNLGTLLAGNRTVYLCDVVPYETDQASEPVDSAVASRAGAGAGASKMAMGFPVFDQDHAITLGAGQSVILARGQKAKVPFGTVIIQPGPGGSSVTLNGQKNTVDARGGVIVSVPVDANGPADNLVVAN